MTTPTVKLGEEILGGDFVYGWEFASGINPVDRVYTVSAARAARINALLGKPQTLDTSSPGRPSSTWQMIFPLEIKAGRDPHRKTVRLADRRWLWPKEWVAITMNKRRATGDTFRVGGDRIENTILVDELRYAKYSLFPPAEPTARWTAKQAIEYVLTAELNTPVFFKDDPVIEVDIQDLILDDPGHDAVARILAYLPGMDLYINREGTAVIYDTATGFERQILEAAPPRQTGGGQVEVVDKRALRPSKVVVLFTPEIEQRFNYTERASGVTQTNQDDTPVLQAVMLSPDVTTTLADGTVVTRGSIAKQQDLFNAWGSFGFFNKPVSFEALRRHATQFGGGSFMQAWGNNPLKPTDPVNTARASVALRSWRRFFQIERFWISRLESVRAYRASILSVDRGIYAPSEIFADWTRRPSYYGYQAGNDANDNQGWAVRGYPQDELLDSARAAPAKVTVADDGSGLIEIEPTLDFFGLTDQQWFGFPEEGLIPSTDAGKAKAQGRALFRHWGLMRFEAGWKMAIVLTVVPGSPNTKERFFQVEVTPDQIATDVGQSEGPVVFARVFPGVMTARFGWRDDQSTAIEDAVRGIGSYADIDDLLLNRSWVTDVARATAARVYESLRDRPIGSMSVDWSPEIEPIGSLSSVEHVMSGGQLVTRANFTAVQQLTDIWRFLNTSTRRAILMTLNNQGSPG